METVKQIEKTEKWISMERAREKNETEIVYQRIQSNSDKNTNWIKEKYI